MTITAKKLRKRMMTQTIFFSIILGLFIGFAMLQEWYFLGMIAAGFAIFMAFGHSKVQRMSDEELQKAMSKDE